MYNNNRYFTMGLREKVALTIAVIILMQIIFVNCSPKSNTLKGVNGKQVQKNNIYTPRTPYLVKNIDFPIQDSKIRSKKSSDKSQEAIRKTFNFPDVEYPTASTPRPHFYLQESNILQRNQIYKPAEIPSSKTAQYSMSGGTKNTKYKNPTKFKIIKSPQITDTFPEFEEEQLSFPEVEYPLNARDTWKPNYGRKNNPNTKDINSYSKIDKSLKLDNDPFSKVSVTSDLVPKSESPQTTDEFKTTPAPSVDTTLSTEPFVFTPYTTLYFDTTPSYIDTETDQNKDTIPPPKKSTMKKKNKKKKKKKPTKKETSLIMAEKYAPKYDEYNNLSPDEPISKRNLNKLDTCTNTNETLSYIYVGTTPSYPNSVEPTSTSAFKIYADDKMRTVSCDNKVASIFDAINAVTSENTDNKDTCFEDKDRNSNKSSICDVDEEFTTDAYSDFDENILSVSTSTISPMSLVAFDEDWTNSVVIDPYKFVPYRDELEEYYIALP